MRSDAEKTVSANSRASRFAEYYFVVGLNEQSELNSRIAWPPAAVSVFGSNGLSSKPNVHRAHSFNNFPEVPDCANKTGTKTGGRMYAKRPSLPILSLLEKEIKSLKARETCGAISEFENGLAEKQTSRLSGARSRVQANGVQATPSAANNVNWYIGTSDKRSATPPAIPDLNGNDLKQSFKELTLSASKQSLSSSERSARESGTDALAEVKSPELAELKSNYPIHYRYTPELLGRYPENNYSEKERLPAFLPLFCFPKDLQLVQTTGRPPATTHHSFTMTEEDGKKMFGVCIVAWEPLCDKLLQDFETVVRAWRKIALDPQDLEYLSHLEHQLEKQEEILRELDSEYGRDDRLSISTTYLSERKKAKEKKDLYLDMLKPLRQTLYLELGRVYAPKCIGVLSRWPWYNFLKDWLCETYVISKQLGEKLPGVLETLVCHLIRYIPLPPPGRLEISLKMNCKYLYCSRPAERSKLRNFSLYPVFRALSLSSIVTLFELVLTEQQIVFVSSHLSMLNAAVEFSYALIEPFQWQYVSIPVLPARLVHYLQAPLPYLIGVSRDIYSDLDLAPGAGKGRGVTEEPAIPKESFVIDLDNDSISGPERTELQLLPPAFRNSLLNGLESSCQNANHGRQLAGRGVPKGMRTAYSDNLNSMPLSAVSCRHTTENAASTPNGAVAALHTSLSKVSSVKSFGLSYSPQSPSLLATDHEKHWRNSHHRKSYSCNSRRESMAKSWEPSWLAHLDIRQDNLAEDRRLSKRSSSNSIPAFDFSGEVNAKGLLEKGSAHFCEKLDIANRDFCGSLPDDEQLKNFASPTYATPKSASSSPIEQKFSSWKELFERDSQRPLVEDATQRRFIEGHGFANYRYDFYKVAAFGGDPAAALADKRWALQSLMLELTDDMHIKCHACSDPLCCSDRLRVVQSSMADKVYVSVCLKCGKAFHTLCTENLEMHPCSVVFDPDKFCDAFQITLAKLLKNFQNYLVPLARPNEERQPSDQTEAGCSSDGMLLSQEFLKKSEFLSQFPRLERRFVARFLDTQAVNLFIIQRLEKHNDSDALVGRFVALTNGSHDRELPAHSSHHADKTSHRYNFSLSRSTAGNTSTSVASSGTSVNKLQCDSTDSFISGSYKYESCGTQLTAIKPSCTAEMNTAEVLDNLQVELPKTIESAVNNPHLSYDIPQDCKFSSSLDREYVAAAEEIINATLSNLDGPVESFANQAETSPEDYYERLLLQQRATQRNQLKQWLKNKVSYFADLRQDELLAFGLLSNDELASLFALKLEQIRQSISAAAELLQDVHKGKSVSVDELSEMLEELYDQNNRIMSMVDEQEFVQADEQAEFSKTVGVLFRIIAQYEDLLKTVMPHDPFTHPKVTGFQTKQIRSETAQ